MSPDEKPYMGCNDGSEMWRKMLLNMALTRHLLSAEIILT